MGRWSLPIALSVTGVLLVTAGLASAVGYSTEPVTVLGDASWDSQKMRWAVKVRFSNFGLSSRTFLVSGTCKCSKEQMRFTIRPMEVSEKTVLIPLHRGSGGYTTTIIVNDGSKQPEKNLAVYLRDI